MMAIPLKSDGDSRRSSSEEALDRIGDKILEDAGKDVVFSTCYEHEICYRTLTSGKSDFVEHTLQGSLRVLAIQAVPLVNPFCLVIGLLRPCNLRLLMLGRLS